MCLNESTSRAEALCAQCAATPDLNPFQPIAVSALEVCRAAADLVGNGNHDHMAQMENLAASVMQETERAIQDMATMPLPFSTEITQILKRLEAKLDEFRRAIERMPRRTRGKLFKKFVFALQAHRLQNELKALVEALLKGTDKIPTAESTGTSAMELTNLTIRVAAAICEAPVLNFLKPVVGIVEIISETAQTVKSNRAAALELAAHSNMVMRSIAEQATTLGLDGPPTDSEALVALKSHPTSSRRLAETSPPSRSPYVLDNGKQKKDHIDEFNQRLDKALALFPSTNVPSTQAKVREIATLVRGNGFVEEMATQVRMNTDQLTAMQTDLAAVLVTVSASTTVQSANEGEKKPNTTALVPFSASVAQLTFFF
ncbi:hypothetical protein MSAN_00340500 [Mycena sanguinolenta]|uniref:Uncharacterized protein n=1 Tax=Mycena sanguinolenta TaxID=230812 RepID=A0A8H7DGH2_9AGAR|nr:hypothetical protein MSAN_00340500 [Mycena sanguinolenta]